MMCNRKFDTYVASMKFCCLFLESLGKAWIVDDAIPPYRISAYRCEYEIYETVGISRSSLSGKHNMMIPFLRPSVNSLVMYN